MGDPVSLPRRLTAEAIGTFALVLAGTGAIATQSVTGAVTHVGIALAFGLVVIAMIAAFGDVSGAHLNPAVSFGFVAARRMSVRDALAYAVAQLFGAAVASVCVRICWPAGASLGVTQPTLISPAACFVLELLLSAGLMLVILGITCSAKEKGLIAGLNVGGTIALEAMFAGPLTGASMNPARSFGPALVAGNWHHFWIYVAAPVAGTLVGVLINGLLRDCDCHPFGRLPESHS